MKRTLIMGGSTFVSRSLAEHFILKGYEVDILTRGVGKLTYTGFREHLKCDRHSSLELQKTLEGKQYDYILDISAYTKNDVSTLLACIDTTALKKYIFCSSAAVYKPGFGALSESDERGENPNWGQYGLDKKEAEDYLFQQYLNTGFPMLIFRPTYIYGENNNLYRESYFFDRIKQRKAIPIPCSPNGQLTQVQFIHIADLCEVFESALTTDTVGKAYNVTHPELMSWEKMLHCFSQVTGIEATAKPIDHEALHVEVRSFFPFRDVNMELDISNLINAGLHTPSIALSDGLRRTYHWYLHHLPQLSDSRMTKVDDL
ncbi:NAD-dependent epimerase/dehydratase family protein [Gorillibacterium massiliense]|uniref:NAD-dependent epimerase/dehydratase family protein n=1 Tax=Gorillibacterium massiliense TaxID=1280390 RepID=UPI0004B79FC7|nr:NAD-dependent epimerase/dehydratase family protein [Gorillibacterium massiliense]